MFILAQKHGLVKVVLFLLGVSRSTREKDLTGYPQIIEKIHKEDTDGYKECSY